MPKIIAHPTNTSLFLLNDVPYNKNVWELYFRGKVVSGESDDSNDSIQVGIKHISRPETLVTPKGISAYKDAGDTPYTDLDTLLNDLILAIGTPGSGGSSSAGAATEATLVEVRDDIRGLSDTLINNTNALLTTIRDDGAAQNILVAATNTLLGDVRTDLAALNTVGQVTNTELANANTELDNIEATVNGMETQDAAFYASLLTQQQAIETVLNGITADTTAIDTKLGTLVTQTDQLETLLTTINTNLDNNRVTNAAALEQLRLLLVDIDTNTDALESELVNIIAEHDQTQVLLTALNTIVTNLETVANASDTKLQDLVDKATTQEAKDQEAIDLLTELRDDALQTTNNSIDRVVGKDDSNDTPIVRVIETLNGVNQAPTYENLDGSVYDLVATGGTFVIDPAVTSQYEFVIERYRATATNAVGGYTINDIVERSRIIDLTNNGDTVAGSEKYYNSNSGADLVTANVIQSELSPSLELPSIYKVENYLLLDTESGSEVIESIIYKVYKSDNTFSWINASGNVVESPITGTQELVRSDLEIEETIDSTTFPITIEANTLKHLEVGVLEGEYTISINDATPETLVNGYLRDFDSRANVDSWVNDKIIINQVTAGTLIIKGKKPSTLRNQAANAGNTVDPQVYIDANSDFMIHTSDASLFTIDGVGDVTQISPPSQTGSTAVFTPTSTGFKYVDAPNGAKAIVGNAVNPLNFSSPVNNTNESRIVALTHEFSANKNIYRFLGFITQLVTLNGDLRYNLNDGSNFNNIALTTAGFTTQELNGQDPVIISVDRTSINGGADQEMKLIIYNQNNPTGITIVTTTRAFTTSTTTSSFAPSADFIHSVHAVELGQKDSFIAVAKQQALITW